MQVQYKCDGERDYQGPLDVLVGNLFAGDAISLGDIISMVTALAKGYDWHGTHDNGNYSIIRIVE